MNQAAPPAGAGSPVHQVGVSKATGRVPRDPAHGRVVLVSHSCGDQAQWL